MGNVKKRQNPYAVIAQDTDKAGSAQLQNPYAFVEQEQRALSRYETQDPYAYLNGVGGFVVRSRYRGEKATAQSHSRLN